MPSEHSRHLWWYVHNAAQLKTLKGWSCERKSFFGHQIMFITAGRGAGRYRGQAWTAGPGQAVLLDLREAHLYHTDPEDPLELHYVRFDGPGVADLFENLYLTAGSPVVPYASIPQMEAHFEELYRLLKTHPPGYDVWAWHHLTGLMALLVEGLRREGLAPDPAPERAPQGVAVALNFLRSHHQRTLAVGDLAREAHMSAYHFTRRFKAATGFTPMEYLEKYRIGRAKEILEAQPERRLTEIAREVGFPDPAYFSRVFRKREGLSPREYRSELQRRVGAR